MAKLRNWRWKSGNKKINTRNYIKSTWKTVDIRNQRWLNCRISTNQILGTTNQKWINRRKESSKSCQKTKDLGGI